MAKRRCKGKTKAGKRCTRRGVEWCAQHVAQAGAADTKRTPKKARARKPKQDDWRVLFLAAFEERGTVIQACRAAGVGRSTVYEERKRNQAFADAWAEVEEDTTEIMEREGYRRAVEGWIERQKFERNEAGELELVEQVRKFSDTLLIFLLKARRPKVYRERIEHSGPGGGPLEHRVNLDLSKLTDEQLAALEAIQPDAGAVES